jgi:dUTP pyrophosphatase
MIQFIDNGNLPAYETESSAGFDITAQEALSILPGGRAKVPTELFIDQSVHTDTEGRSYVWEIQIRPRSGLALNKGITVLNSPGTIDQDYPSQICVILLNTSGQVFTVNQGDRIAQGVLAKAYRMPQLLVKNVRRSGGFGSSGM